MIVYFSIPMLNTRLTHHALACYVTKFESQSFRLRFKNGLAFAQQESCWRSQQSASKSRGKGGPIPGNFF